jgi:nitroreductase
MAATPDDTRSSDYPADPLFRRRWSPRAMSGEAVSPEELMTLFEAARWAPSSYNSQPWRFLYARQGTAHWPLFFGLLIEFNQSWAKDAGALVLMISRTTFAHNGQPSSTHGFDAGAAWGNLALQGSPMGLVVHGMAGFDAARARTLLNVPEEFAVQAMAAIGRPGPVERLPEPLRAREVPSGRMPLAEITREGGFA